METLLGAGFFANTMMEKEPQQGYGWGNVKCNDRTCGLGAGRASRVICSGLRADFEMDHGLWSEKNMCISLGRTAFFRAQLYRIDRMSSGSRITN